MNGEKGSKIDFKLSWEIVLQKRWKYHKKGLSTSIIDVGKALDGEGNLWKVIRIQARRRSCTQEPFAKCKRFDYVMRPITTRWSIIFGALSRELTTNKFRNSNVTSFKVANMQALQDIGRTTKLYFRFRSRMEFIFEAREGYIECRFFKVSPFINI